jgi:S-DNA-T family DNA segregation ATPase FtsK/SpoIIIE
MTARGTPGSSRPSRGGRSVASRRGGTRRNWEIPGHIIRQLIGIAMALVGVTLLTGLTLPGGSLTDWERNATAPYFGTVRWLLPFVLMLLGYYLYRARGDRWDWELTLLGSAVAYVSLCGFVGLVQPGRAGIVGRTVAHSLAPLVTALGAGVLLTVLMVGGALVAIDMSLPAVIAPLATLVSRALDKLFRPAPKPEAGTQPGRHARPAKEAGDLPAPAQSQGPVSSTLASDLATVAGGAAATPAPAQAEAIGEPGAGSIGTGEAAHGPTIRDGGHARSYRDGAAGTGAEGEGGRVEGAPGWSDLPREYTLPPLALLDDIAPRNGGTGTDHERNAAIIQAKLASFDIPARVLRWNAGPVVTQYEVEPAPDVKVSRIEALADDLAMALAARTIRIEAPIPGKSVVGIEIPNRDFNIVALRRILQEVDFQTSSKVTFALGRDVAGHARAADLAKMPHLLIAGATGSGKSVMVNALITSLLCRATPDEVRLIVVDLKRVELQAYNGLPHLMVPVVTEVGRAKAALRWAVREMEDRYRRFAGAGARNLTAYNESRADPADRLPYLVIIIDELQDLIIREGREVEEPIVRLAQKARATGIHLVLATQRPSVNVVTGLIKANFPSRIAFHMTSQVDSRTILDTPGAEDLIGRGDMLYQPADLPRPMRLQGVFVSDKEIGNIVAHWRAEAEPHYDLDVVATDEEEGGGGPLMDEEADRLLPDAVGVVQEYDRASASLLQRRLKIGYARAARIIDQLEARGYIGPFDGSNARQVLRHDGAVPGTHTTGHGEEEV